jgi:hypothetical protein
MKESPDSGLEDLDPIYRWKLHEVSKDNYMHVSERPVIPFQSSKNGRDVL